MSSRPGKVASLREDLPPTISSATHPDTTRTTVCIHTGAGRNLVLNLDGTANQFSDKSTNVVELFSRLIKDEGQLVYYDSGIGTYARPSFKSLSYLKQVIYHAIDTAIAWNFETIVHAAYKWLSENYQPGDKIFLFGFSRGAYQARVIAGMIEKVGLLHKGNERQIPFAYELYSSVIDSTKREQETPEANESLSREESKEEELCRQFKRSLCHKDAKVHFVGAWDTVSSIGVLRGNSLPETVSGMGHVCAFRHALALDERRVKFQPEYANGGLGPRETDKANVKEVWFSGSHSDIGGGNTLNRSLRNFGPALRWMTYEAMTFGLRIEPYEGTWEPPTLTESLKGFWNFLEILPFPCLSYKDENSLTWVPHLSASRKIPNGHLIHQSVLRSMSNNCIQSNHGLPPNADVDHSDETDSHMPGAFPKMEAVLPISYTPSATFSTTGWNQLCIAYEASMTLDIVEKDPFEDASHALDSFAAICLLTEVLAPSSLSLAERFSNQLNILHSFLEDETRLASLVEVPSAGGTLLTALGVAVNFPEAAATREAKETLIRLLVRCRLVPTTARLPLVSQVYQWGSRIRCAYRDDFTRILQPFACLATPQHSGIVVSMVFSSLSPERVIIIRTSQNRYIDICMSMWDGGPQPLNDLIGVEWNAAFSGDGTHVALWEHGELRVIDTTSLVVQSSDKNITEMGALCFSYDHQILASVHRRSWITLWRLDGDQWKMYKNFRVADNDNNTYRLAFSRDGSRLAFNSGPVTMKLWRLADDTLIELENFDMRDIFSLTWSPSGNQVVTGGFEGKVKIWNSNKGTVEHILRPSGRTVRCLAFRNDGEVLAGGGEDNKVRLWRCDTWAKIAEFDTGESVMSIAFSPDGMRLVSGGREGAIYLWDVDMRDNEGDIDYSTVE